MQNYSSNDEQLDAIKHWWDENGKSVIAGVVLAAAAVVGWTGYSEWKERTLNNAALAWHELELAVQDGTLPHSKKPRSWPAATSAPPTPTSLVSCRHESRWTKVMTSERWTYCLA